MKKKILALVLTLTLGASAMLAPAARASALDAPGEAKSAAVTSRIASIQIGIPDAFVNNKKTYIDTSNKKVTPIKISGKTMIPLRFCATSMGGTCTYISDKDYITIRVNGRVAMVKIGSKAMTVTDSAGKVLRRDTLDVAPVKRSGRVLVPTRAISQGLGSQVYYEKLNQKEYVVVSNQKITRDIFLKQVDLFTAQPSTKTFTDSTKTFKVSLSSNWVAEPTGFAGVYFENSLYPSSFAITDVISAAEAKEYLGYTKADWEYEHDEKITSLTKLTINGNPAVLVTFSITDPDDPKVITSFQNLIIASPKAGLDVMAVYEDDGFESAFKKLYSSIIMLK